MVPSHAQARPEEAVWKYLSGAIWSRTSHLPIVGTRWVVIPSTHWFLRIWLTHGSVHWINKVSWQSWPCKVAALGRGWTISSLFMVLIVLCLYMGQYDFGLGFEIVLYHPEVRPTRHNIIILAGSRLTSHISMNLSSILSSILPLILSSIISLILLQILSSLLGYNVIIYLIFYSLPIVFKLALCPSQ